MKEVARDLWFSHHHRDRDFYRGNFQRGWTIWAMSDADSSIIYIFSCCMLMGQNLQILRKSSEYFSVQHHHNNLVTNGVNKARDTNEWLAREVLRRQDNHRTFSHHRLYQLFSRWLLLLATHTRLSLLHQYAWNEAIHK